MSHGEEIEFLDGAGVGYAIVAKEYAPIKRWARGGRLQKLRTGWEVGEFECQPSCWGTPDRFVVVRRPIPSDPVEARQLTPFTDTQYADHVLVTNLRIQPWQVCRFCAPRARVEKQIRELLYDSPPVKIPTVGSVPNVVVLQLLLFASDVMHYSAKDPVDFLLCDPLLPEQLCGRFYEQLIEIDFIGVQLPLESFDRNREDSG